MWISWTQKKFVTWEKNSLGSPQKFFSNNINLAAVTPRKSSDVASVQLKNKKKKRYYKWFYIWYAGVNKHVKIYETSTQMITDLHRLCMIWA